MWIIQLFRCTLMIKWRLFLEVLRHILQHPSGSTLISPSFYTLLIIPLLMVVTCIHEISQSNWLSYDVIITYAYFSSIFFFRFIYTTVLGAISPNGIFLDWHNFFVVSLVGFLGTTELGISGYFYMVF